MKPSPAVLELVRLALACGAADLGGTLSPAELALARAVGSTTRRAGGRVRAAIRDGEDPLGEFFCRIQPTSNRRKLGAFYTGFEIVDAMMKWIFEQDPYRIVDPGCGSGRFSVAAAKRRKSLAVIAIDIDPVATLLTRAALAAVGASNARVVHGDYLEIEIPRIEQRTAFVGNPPYVRHHHLEARTKEHMASLAKCAGYPFSRLAGLHALFYLATLALHAQRGDIGSFVTSSEWLDVGYGSLIREAFTNGLGGQSLTVFDPEAIPFLDAMTTAAITTFKIGRPTNSIRLARVSSSEELGQLDFGRRIKRSELSKATRWTALLRGPAERDGAPRIGSVFRVSRGQVTGANDYFVMHRARARELGIEEFCVPIVASAEEVFQAGCVLRDTPQRKVALEIPKDIELSRHAALGAYISAGEAAKVNQRYVARHRQPWYALAFPRPPIVATYMARQAPHFARNPDGLGVLNIAHGLYPRRQLDEETLDKAVAELNARRKQYVGRGRTYHGGLEKFEPREMENLPFDISE